MGKLIDGPAHVGIMVGDLQTAIDFYTNILEFELIERTAFKKGHIGFVQNGGLILELVQPGEYATKVDGPVDHIALCVHDIEKVKTRLEERGIKFLDEEITYAPPIFPNGSKFIMFLGPFGEKIEINEVL